jgi:hypothetical protein
MSKSSKREDKIVKFVPDTVSVDDLPPNYMSLISLVLGFVGLLMKVTM